MIISKKLKFEKRENKPFLVATENIKKGEILIDYSENEDYSKLEIFKKCNWDEHDFQKPLSFIQYMHENGPRNTYNNFNERRITAAADIKKEEAVVDLFGLQFFLDNMKPSIEKFTSKNKT